MRVPDVSNANMFETFDRVGKKMDCIYGNAKKQGKPWKKFPEPLGMSQLDCMNHNPKIAKFEFLSIPFPFSGFCYSHNCFTPYFQGFSGYY